MNGLFVTGTDTEIGKTVISSLLMCTLRETENVCYWKPVQTGIEQDNDTETVRILANCGDDEIFDFGYRLEKPLSPHLSARLSGVEITIDKILEFIKEVDSSRFWIVEGAGGVLVPLNADTLMIDLIKALDLPVLIVARSGLGTINHTLLTIESLRNQKIEIYGVIMNGEPNSENRKAIESYGKVRVIAQIPKFTPLDGKNIRHYKEDLNLFDNLNPPRFGLEKYK